MIGLGSVIGLGLVIGLGSGSGLGRARVDLIEDERDPALGAERLVRARVRVRVKVRVGGTS